MKCAKKTLAAVVPSGLMPTSEPAPKDMDDFFLKLTKQKG